MEKYTKEILENAVKESKSIAGVLRYLGLKQAGGTQYHISNKIKRLEIDTSHFTGQGHMKGKPSRNKRHWKEILVKRTQHWKEDTSALRRAMIESGIECKCVRCGINEWLTEKLVLPIHHKNGDAWDNRKSNLEFRCPNCHSQTDNYCKSGCSRTGSRRLV